MYVKSCSLSFQRMPGRFDHDGSQNDAGESAEGRVEAPSWACLLLIVSGSSGFPPPLLQRPQRNLTKDGVVVMDGSADLVLITGLQTRVLPDTCTLPELGIMKKF